MFVLLQSSCHSSVLSLLISRGPYSQTRYSGEDIDVILMAVIMMMMIMVTEIAVVITLLVRILAYIPSMNASSASILCVCLC